MATKRLTCWEKEQILNSVAQALAPLLSAAQCPVEDREHVAQLFRDGWDPEIRGHVEAIERKQSELGAPHAYMSVLSLTYNYAINIGGKYRVSMTRENHEPPPLNVPSTLPSTHPMYAPLMEFCGWKTENKNMVDTSTGFARGVVDACSTAGQIERVLPFLAEYLPDTAGKSLLGARRVSKWPKSICYDKEFRRRSEELHNSLALAALVVTERKSIVAVASL